MVKPHWYDWLAYQVVIHWPFSAVEGWGERVYLRLLPFAGRYAYYDPSLT